MSDIEDRLEVQMAQAFQPMQTGAPMWVRELTFAPPRRWRFDFAWPDLLLAVEVEGGIWTYGGHSRGAGLSKDIAKYNEAALLGWIVIRVTGQTIHTGEALATIERAVACAQERSINRSIDCPACGVRLDLQVIPVVWRAS